MKTYEVLSNRRKEKKVSFDELAQKTGISISTLKKTLTGVTTDPAFGLVKAIAYALDMTLDEVIAAEKGQGDVGSLSPAALALAKRYDRMDVHGKRMLETVADLESDRMDQDEYDRAVETAGAIYKEVMAERIEEEAATRERLLGERHGSLK